jgi:hypothetical protein
MYIKVRLAHSMLTLHVDEHDPVSVIHRHLQNLDPCCLFLLGESVISTGFTFGYYGIRDADEILVIEPPKHQIRDFTKRPTVGYLPTLCQFRQHTTELSRVFGFPPGPESVQRALDELSDPRIAGEAARIRDQYFTRIEGTVLSHRRLLSQLTRIVASEYDDGKEEEVPQTKYAEEIKAASPSDGELPTCWKKRRGKAFKA